MDDDVIRRVRSFNRTVAERIGALEDGFLGRGRPMIESRTLWEIGAGDAADETGSVRMSEPPCENGPEEQRGIEVRTLRARLALDSGYTSRVLRSLERQGLVTVEPSPGDRRVRQARLTEAGLAERAELDRRADVKALSFLEPLTDGQQARLVAAMAEVERLLRASQVTFVLEDPTTPDARWCIDQYFAELNTRFDAGFDPSLSISAEASELTPPVGALLVARLQDRAVGCGALKFHPDAPAELKRMWVSNDSRGIGLGRRLLGALEAYAREAGATVLRLETNQTLREAIALYRSSGYQEVPRFSDEPYAHHWFEKRL